MAALVKITPLEDLLRHRRQRRFASNGINGDESAAQNSEIRLCSAGVQLRFVEEPFDEEHRHRLESRLRQITDRIEEDQMKTRPAPDVTEETKVDFMDGLGLQRMSRPPKGPFSKSSVVRVLGGLKGYKSFMKNPVIPLNKVACVAKYLRIKGNIISFTPVNTQQKVKGKRKAVKRLSEDPIRVDRVREAHGYQKISAR